MPLRRRGWPLTGRARVAFLAIALTSFSTVAGAAPDDAKEQSRAAFRKGVSQVKAGDYAAARDAFLEAYRLFAHPSILLNIGIARSKTGEFVDAEQDLSRFLSDDGGASPDEITSARSALGEVRQHLGTLRLKVAPDTARATLDAKNIALAPGDYAIVRATLGPHDLHIEADGYEPHDQKVEIVREKETVTQVALFSSKRTKLEVPAEPTDSTRPILGWSLVGASAALVGVGAFCGLTAIKKKNDYNAQSAPQDASLRSSGVTFRTISDISFLAAIVSGGVGAYFLLTRSPRGSAQVVVGPLDLGVRGTF
jgi:hypothetical protein